MKISIRLFFNLCLFFGLSLSLSAQKIQAYVDYIAQYSPIALKHRDKYKIPASITLAQGILESGAGKGDLAKSASNHFGIKCRSDWTGDRVFRQDDNPNDCFRKYESVEDSYEDHARFLLQNSRYAVLFTYDIRDYESWAKGLQNCGYATDKGYANKLISIIQNYELYEYDGKAPQQYVPPKEVVKEEKQQQTTPTPTLSRNIYKAYDLLYVIAVENDSFKRIADDLGFKEKDLANYNDAPEDFPLNPGDIVYLEKKKDKADKPYLRHVVKIGDSMYTISQEHGIQLKSLYKMNKKDADYIPIEGDIVILR